MSERHQPEGSGCQDRHVIYWDIDGTLLTTARAGVPALEDGAEAAVGVRPDLSTMQTAGMTDRMIARAVLADLGHGPDPDLERAMLDAYAEALPDRLAEKRGRVLPGIEDTLCQLVRRGDVVNTLLTGNVRAGAEAKLRSYGLWDYFWAGGFAEDGYDRTSIARAAVARVAAEHGDAARRGVLVGDTPYDVEAGNAVGLRVLAVATREHPAEELRQLQPWWVTERVPTADELVSRMHGGPR
jgi:phosphoglycolate phosphatase